MINILVLEDDLAMGKLLEFFLTSNGFNVFMGKNGYDGLNVLDNHSIDLIVSDIMMPDMDGIEFTKTIRDAGINIPVLMLTAKTYIDDKKKGFLAGSDDYLTKPVDEEELLLRINALLRRAGISTSKQIKIGKVVVDYSSMTVRDGNSLTELPPKEFLLLYKLLSYPNKIFTRFQIMDEIWGMDSETDDVTINVHINRLRNRFENIKEFEIVTVRGLGYKAIYHE